MHRYWVLQKKRFYVEFVAGNNKTYFRPARPRTQHDCHHDTKVKPEAATAVIELLMMGGKTHGKKILGCK